MSRVELKPAALGLRPKIQGVNANSFHSAVAVVRASPTPQGSWVDVFEGKCFDGRLHRLAVKPSDGHTHRKCAMPIGSMIVGPRATVELTCRGPHGHETIRLKPGSVLPALQLPGTVERVHVIRR